MSGGAATPLRDNTALTLGELAEKLGAQAIGDRSIRISGVADLLESGPEALAPFTDPSRFDEARDCGAAALLVRHYHPELGKPQLVCPDPRRVLGELLAHFASPPAAAPPGIDARAVVEEGACIHASASVGPLCYVGAGARIGADSQVLPFSYIGPGVEVGRRCTIGPRATLLAGTSLDDLVRVAPGAVVGGEGFGFSRQPDGSWHRIPSLGRVHLAERVELGAGSCVDRGTLGVTRVGRGSKIDNLVQVGHNALLGENVLLCAQVGLAGSSRLEDGCVLGGQAGVADHRRVGAGARVAAQAGVASDVPAGACVGGSPAIDEKRWLRASVLFSRLADLVREVRALRRELEELREQKENRQKQIEQQAIEQQGNKQRE